MALLVFDQFLRFVGGFEKSRNPRLRTKMAAAKKRRRTWLPRHVTSSAQFVDAKGNSFQPTIYSSSHFVITIMVLIQALIFYDVDNT